MKRFNSRAFRVGSPTLIRSLSELERLRREEINRRGIDEGERVSNHQQIVAAAGVILSSAAPTFSLQGVSARDSAHES